MPSPSRKVLLCGGEMKNLFLLKKETRFVNRRFRREVFLRWELLKYFPDLKMVIWYCLKRRKNNLIIQFAQIRFQICENSDSNYPNTSELSESGCTSVPNAIRMFRNLPQKFVTLSVKIHL